MFKTDLKVCVTGFKKKSTQRHLICLTDAGYDYILDEIDSWDKIEFKVL